eukprot:544320_1
MSEKKVNKPDIQQHLSSVNNITQQYTQIIQYFDQQLNNTIATVSSMGNSIKNIETILEKQQTQQTELINRITAVEQTLFKQENNQTSKPQNKSLNLNSSLFNKNVSKTLPIKHKNKTSNNQNKVINIVEASKRFELSDDVKNLIQTIQLYNNNTIRISDLNIPNILSQFLYAMETYDNEKHFGVISKAIGSCDIQKCHSFERNYRDRNQPKKTCDKIEIAHNSDAFKTQIMDKIHCFWQHCYDIGNNVSVEDFKE